MIRKILQYLANDIINRLELTTDDQVFKYLYEFGVMLDYFCISVFDIYLE